MIDRFFFFRKNRSDLLEEALHHERLYYIRNRVVILESGYKLRKERL